MKIPCGRTLGHGESCVEGYLCDVCENVRYMEKQLEDKPLPPALTNDSPYRRIELAQAAVDKARTEFLIGEGWLFAHVGDLRLWSYPRLARLRDIGKTILVTDTRTAMSIQAEFDNDPELKHRLGIVR